MGYIERTRDFSLGDRSSADSFPDITDWYFMYCDGCGSWNIEAQKVPQPKFFDNKGSLAAVIIGIAMLIFMPFLIVVVPVVLLVAFVAYFMSKKEVEIEISCLDCKTTLRGPRRTVMYESIGPKNHTYKPKDVPYDEIRAAIGRKFNLSAPNDQWSFNGKQCGKGGHPIESYAFTDNLT